MACSTICLPNVDFKQEMKSTSEAFNIFKQDAREYAGQKRENSDACKSTSENAEGQDPVSAEKRSI